MSALDKSKNYEFDQLIGVVKRENNKKRSFLFLNRLQAKYVPSNPEMTLDLFQTLGNKVAERYKGKKTIIIGFAETATAIGAAVASCFTDDSFYVHTTREELNHSDLVAAFEEEHSHATSHLIYSQNKEVWKDCDVIIFVDDEFTTGKTICNFAEALCKKDIIPEKTLFAAVSLINCMSEENLERFRQSGIEYEYIIKEDRTWDAYNWDGEIIADTEYSTDSKDVCIKPIAGRIEIRKGAYIKDYQRACKALYETIEAECPIKNSDQKILILGTEECMYPAIVTARDIQLKNPEKEVQVYATSRSPILPLTMERYPVFNRSKLRSLYNKEREVFLYNILPYDKIIIVTDSKFVTKEALEDVVSALRYHGNKDITFVTWEEA